MAPWTWAPRQGGTTGRAGRGARRPRLPAGILALAAILLALAWPAGLYWNTKAGLSRIDAEISALRPDVEEGEVAVGGLIAVGAKISLLREASAGRGEAFLLLKEPTH